MQLQEIKNKYFEYRFNCYNQGDIWNMDYKPYTFDEWINNGQPENGGYEIKKKK